MNKINILTITVLIFCFITVAPPSAGCHQLGEVVDGYKIGKKLPYWKLQFIDKDWFDFNKSLGKEYVLIFFWSRYFKHFDETLKFGRRLYLQNKDRNLRFLGVSLDSNRKQMMKTLEAYDIDFRHTYNPYLTFPDRLLASISKTEGSVIIFNKNREIALIWQLSTDEDYNEIQNFLDRKLYP